MKSLVNAAVLCHSCFKDAKNAALGSRSFHSLINAIHLISMLKVLNLLCLLCLVSCILAYDKSKHNLGGICHCQLLSVGWLVCLSVRNLKNFSTDLEDAMITFWWHLFFYFCLFVEYVVNPNKDVDTGFLKEIFSIVRRGRITHSFYLITP